MVKARKKAVHIPLDQISKTVVSIFETVYKDDNRNSYKKGVKDLFLLYKQERDCDVNKDEFSEEITYRANKFVDNLSDSEGQLRLIKTLGVLAGQVLVDLDDNTLVDALVSAIHQKKNHPTSDIRCSVVSLIGRIYLSTMKEPDEDEDETNCFPSYLKLTTFAELYDILIQMFNDHAASVRMAVILALKHVCKYPGLVGALKMDPMYSPSQLVLVGTKDPDEDVRKYALSNLPLLDKSYAKYLLECLIHDPSENVRMEVARRISGELCLADFEMKDIVTVFRDKALFLDDNIVPEYYDILISWASDAYRIKKAKEMDEELCPEEICKGSVCLLEWLNYSKEWHLVYPRFFEHMRRKFFNDYDNENSFVKFAKLFSEGESICMNSTNYMDFIGLSTENAVKALNQKLIQFFMWLSLSEYCLHGSLMESTRTECRLVILPTMVDCIGFIKGAILTIQREGEIAVETGILLGSINPIQVSAIKCLIKLIPLLDRDDPGMNEWKNLLNYLLTDNEINFRFDNDLYQLITYQYLFYHFDIKNPLELERAVHEIGDICYSIVGVGQVLNSSQDLASQTVMNVSQNTVLDTTTSQIPSTREEPHYDMSEEQKFRCVSILAAVVKTGFILKPCTVFDGLIINFGVRAFDESRDLVTKKMAFLCIAGRAAITDQNERNFVRYARRIIENPYVDKDQLKAQAELKKIAVMMLCDCIQVYGYGKVVDLYFQKMPDEEDGSVDKYNLVHKLIELAEEKNILQLAGFTVRILMRLIIFDYGRTFKDGMIYIFKRMFRKTKFESEIAPMTLAFFVNYISYSREHQCIFGTMATEAVISLSECDPDSGDFKIDIQNMAEVILNLTSFSALLPNAIGRDEGTAHSVLARNLFLKLSSIDEENRVCDILGYMISQCEVTELCDMELVANLKKACKKFVYETNSSKLKKNIETYYKRLESLDRYLETKKTKIQDSPVSLTVAELEKEMQGMINKLKNMNEETNSNYRSWIEVPTNDENPPKIKIWGEKILEINKLKAFIAVENQVPPPQQPPKSSKRPHRTPAKAPTPKKNQVLSTPKATTRLTRPSRKRLGTIEEVEMDFAE